MKIKWGMMMTDGRGKLGGQVASKNRAGAYVRTKVTPDNPQTVYQQENRAFLGNISSAWSALSTQAQLAWNSAVEDWKKTDIFGDLRKPTGKNLFTALNKPRLQYGQLELLDFPPEKLRVPIPTQVNMVVTESAFQVQIITDEPVQAGDVGIVELTPNMSRGVFYAKNRYRVVRTAVKQSTGANFTLTMTQAVQARYGELPQPDNFNSFVRVRIMSAATGQISVALAGLVVNGELIPDPEEEE